MNDFISLKKATELYGVSTSFLYKKVSKNEIPHYKFMGKRVFFKIQELDDWFSKQYVRIRSDEEVQQEAQLIIKKGRFNV